MKKTLHLLPAFLFAAILLAGVASAQDPVPLRFSDLWTETADGLEFSEMALEQEGERVLMRAYAAPQLRADVDFMIASDKQLAVCPFCEDEADVPPDIVFVKLPRGWDGPHFGGYEIVGTLELGAATDPETGFVSLVRIDADSVERP